MRSSLTIKAAQIACVGAIVAACGCQQIREFSAGGTAAPAATPPIYDIPYLTDITIDGDLVE